MGKNCPRRLPNKSEEGNERRRQSRNTIQLTADQLSTTKFVSDTDGHRRSRRGPQRPRALIATLLSNYPLKCGLHINSHSEFSAELRKK